jgi:hypothetical protein
MMGGTVSEKDAQGCMTGKKIKEIGDARHWERRAVKGERNQKELGPTTQREKRKDGRPWKEHRMTG